MIIKFKYLLFALLITLAFTGLASATDGDISRTSPAENVSISELDSQVFEVAITNTDPANQTYTINWYVDNVLKQTTATNATSDTYTYNADSSSAGTYTVKCTSNGGGAATEITWNLTVAGKIFAGISEVLSATVGILPAIVSLIVGIVPVMVTLAVVSLITGIFVAIVAAIKGGGLK